jgi:murein L,D-transpeptidase YafK
VHTQIPLRRRAFIPRRYILIPLFLLQVAFAPLCSAEADAEEVWVLVDTSRLTLTVKRGEDTLKEYENIAIGSNGPTLAKRVNDETTPLGDFRVARINPKSRFRTFMGFDYPTMEHAQRALADGRLGPEEYLAINNAWLAHQPPPQNTTLGGNLGIHGLGVGDEKIHGRFNWTEGCIAVTNEQIDELAQWVGIGTLVSVR